MQCPFCLQTNDDTALVCNACARDITVPPLLISERDDLIAKRDRVRDELCRARAELDAHYAQRKRK